MVTIQLNERIIQIVSVANGIKASRLCSVLACEYLGLTGKEIRDYLIHMIRNNELVEIEFTLPNGRNESIILPSGSQFRGVSVK